MSHLPKGPVLASALSSKEAVRNWLNGYRSLQECFTNAVRELWMAFQPIVSWRNRAIYGYEAIVRSKEAALAQPSSLLKAAEDLGRLYELGRVIRRRVAEAAHQVPESILLFVNVHPVDLEDDDLCDPAAPLSGIASRVVLEITERAAIDHVPDMRSRIAELRRMGFRFAVDDLGAGYAGLTSLVLLEPEIVKLDMSLIREIATQKAKRQIVHSMSRLCNDLGITIVAEGVETADERDVLVELECDLQQGFLFGRPDPSFLTPQI